MKPRPQEHSRARTWSYVVGRAALLEQPADIVFANEVMIHQPLLYTLAPRVRRRPVAILIRHSLSLEHRLVDCR
jgi:hypothetical protein